MDSLTFTPGRAFLSSNSPAVPWTAVFEDEGPAGYFYACDRSQETQEHSIMDAMLIYNTVSLQEPERERLASIQWSRDGQQCALYLDGTAQAFIDFAAKTQLLPLRLPQLPGRTRRPLAQELPRLGRCHPPALRSRNLRLKTGDRGYEAGEKGSGATAVMALAFLPSPLPISPIPCLSPLLPCLYAHGSITIFVTSSFLSRQISYIAGASSSVMRCEMM